MNECNIKYRHTHSHTHTYNEILVILQTDIYIVPMEFSVHFFPRISAFSRRTKMHLNEMLLIGFEFSKIIQPPGVSTTVTAIPQGYRHNH